MPVRFFGPSGSATAYDADVISWWTAVIANGGSVSAARLGIVNTFVVSEKNAGTWALTDDYLLLAAENAIQALTSLKQRRLASAVNSPTFTPDRGYTGDGTTSYLNTGFVPSTHAVAMSTNNVRLAVYERQSVGGSGASAGVNDSSSRALHVRGTGSTLAANSTSGTFTSAVTPGLISGSRNGSLVTDVVGYKNAVSLPRTVDPSAVGGSLPTGSIFALALNSGGSAALFRASQISLVAFGAALSAGQEASQYSNVQAWATSVGANV